MQTEFIRNHLYLGNFRSLKDSFSDLTNHLEKNPPSQVAPVMHHTVMNSVDSHCAN